MNPLPHSSPDHKRRIWIITGEVSGDMHGAGLVQHLRKLIPQASFAGIGGPCLEAEGVLLYHHIQELAVMGFSEVFLKLRSIMKIFRNLVKRMKVEKPVAVILVDFPDFNLRFARKAFKAGVPVIYYISPQLWAWRKRRINTIKKYVRKMIVIFPFEEEFFKNNGVDAYFTGYPLAEKLSPQNYQSAHNRSLFTEEKDHFLIGILPGSRNTEIRKILPPLLASAALIRAEFPNTTFIIPRASTADSSLLQDLIRARGVAVQVVDGRTYEVMANSDFLLTASGTATLEATCLTTPMIVVYRMTPLNYFIARRLVKVPHIAMANLVAGYRLVPELIQHDLTAENVFRLARQFMLEPERLQTIRSGLEAVRQKLQSKDAYHQAALAVYHQLQRIE
ncbi:lipid-A-disaccharide synthase [candidate division CSSED10-310 bacterium]|uniref:Lipid-A-disaccharide synthase n=1 Tax=candidate division CSSED10-310 bacterium TaxID=2855610 RepID=A0ABV6YX50_UNCC1